MPNDRDYNRELAEYRAFQQEMTAVGREQSQARQADWSREMEAMAATWQGFQQDWEGTLQHMTGSALAAFDEISAQGEAAGNNLVDSWRQALDTIRAEVEAWGEQMLESLDGVGRGLSFTSGGGAGGAAGDLLSWVSVGLGLGGIFHEGGIIEAHNGLVLSPETLLADERLVKVQTGEGILPREAMVQLGEENFEALRTGRFQVNPGSAAPRYDITIQVHTLDAAGVAGLDWDKVVQRHLLPALEREMSRRW